MAPLRILVAEPWDDYALIDSGAGRKLERYGRFNLIRPEPQALWTPSAPEWVADGEFTGGSDETGGGRWRLDDRVPADGWPLRWDRVRFQATCTPFRHLGFFPDMAPQWAWMRERVAPGAEVLNLFGYTGVATLVLAEAGARVTHVDASKKAVAGGQANQRLAGLDGAPVRWLIDDAPKFVQREARRGRRYAGIILDPPKFGRGPRQEVWKLEEGLGELVAGCARLVADGPAFLVLTVYAVRLSALALGRLVTEALGPLGGMVEPGEMTVREERRGLLLPTAIFARWSREGA